MTSRALELLLGPDRHRVAGPEPAAIGKALEAATRDPKRWVTLSWGDHDYVTAAPASEGFEVQLRDNSPTEQWRIVQDPLPLENVLQIFAAFAVKHTGLIGGFGYRWERVPLLDIDDFRSPHLPG